VGVAEFLVLVLAVPAMYLLLFILVRLETWLDAGARQARPRQASVPGAAAVFPHAVAGPLAGEPAATPPPADPTGGEPGPEPASPDGPGTTPSPMTSQAA
jgi:hypothetical protein